MPKFSVVVCTYNRRAYLKDLLDCLFNQEGIDVRLFEIVVVDNNSCDKTEDLLKSYVSKFQGRLRYFFEPKQGKPFALNLGIKQARGEILVFTDDDCLVEKDYLFNIDKVFQEHGDDAGIVGGKIRHYWVNGSRPPEWFMALELSLKFKGFFEGPLGILDYGDKPFVIDYALGINKNHLFFGANISIRKEALEYHGYFDTEKILAQDTEICLRLLGAGVKGVYAPQIIVQHKVDAQKITPRYYYRWYYLRGKYRELTCRFDQKFFYPLGIPTWLIRQTVAFYLKSFFEKSRYARYHCRCMAFFHLGQMMLYAKSTGKITNQTKAPQPASGPLFSTMPLNREI